MLICWGHHLAWVAVGILASIIWSKPGNQTLVLRYSFVFLTFWFPSQGSRTTLSLSDLVSTARDPRRINLPTTASSAKTGLNWGQRAFRSGIVKYSLAIALLSSLRSGSLAASSSHKTASGNTACKTALMLYFLNSSSSSVTVHTVLWLALESCAVCGSGCLELWSVSLASSFAFFPGFVVKSLQVNSHLTNSKWGGGLLAGKQGH